jgi:hypothetical protein
LPPRFPSSASCDGTTEQPLPSASCDVLWTSDDATGIRPLIVLAHGGGLHKKASAVLA